MKHAQSIWSRIVSPDQADLAPEVAEYFLTLGFSEKDKARYQLLAAKEQTDLAPDERSELESLVAANTALMLLQAKARLSLKRRQPAA